MLVKYNKNEHGYDFKMFKCNAESATRIDETVSNHSLRDNFARDRDRIMYSKAFRRLNGKTQIFLAGKDDHARNRLTHTLEVAQIARTIAKALGLNETLVEAMALGHDIGHTPFGHVGERTLNQIVSGCYKISGYNDGDFINDYLGFKHNWQSMKVATLFTDDLKLTRETLWGMLNHSDLKLKECDYKTKGEDICNFRLDRDLEISNENNSNKFKGCIFKDDDDRLNYYKNYSIYKNGHLQCLKDSLKDEEVWSIEGYIVAVADEIAQRHHDLEDAIEYKLISREDLVSILEKDFEACKKDDTEYYKQNVVKDIFTDLKFCEENENNFNELKDASEGGTKELFLSYLSRFIVNLLTSDVIHNTAGVLNKIIDKHNFNEQSKFENIRGDIFEEFKKHKKLMSPLMEKYDKDLQLYLKDRVLNSYEAQRMDGIGEYIIRELFKAYIVNPQQLPDKSIIYVFNNYYKLKYSCGCKANLENDGYLNRNGNYDVGAMRIELKKLHFSHNNNKYKVALVRTICDYIAGMTDKYAMEKQRELYNIKYE